MTALENFCRYCKDNCRFCKISSRYEHSNVNNVKTTKKVKK